MLKNKHKQFFKSIILLPCQKLFVKCLRSLSKFLTFKQSFLFTFATKYPFSTTEKTPETETTERVKVEDLEAQLLDALDKLAENYDEEN